MARASAKPQGRDFAVQVASLKHPDVSRETPSFATRDAKLCHARRQALSRETPSFVMRDDTTGNALQLHMAATRRLSSGTDIASIFSDGGISASSASTASLNPVQTTGIREVSRALLSQEDLKALYITAVRNVERRKARAHIRGFLKEYGRNLLKEASNRSLEIQAAKFVQELAGRIADEIGWSITGFEEESWPPETGLAKKDLEIWLSSLQHQSVDVEKELRTSGLAASVDEMFEEGDSDEELDSGLQFPNIDKVKDFLLNETLLLRFRKSHDHSRNDKRNSDSNGQQQTKHSMIGSIKNVDSPPECQVWVHYCLLLVLLVSCVILPHLSQYTLVQLLR
jgi:hypothetical protein